MKEYELPIAWKWHQQRSLTLDLQTLLSAITGIDNPTVLNPLASLFHAQADGQRHFHRSWVTHCLGTVELTNAERRRLQAAFEFARWIYDSSAPSVMTAQAIRLRAQVPLNETVLLAIVPNHHDPPITLSLGTGLGHDSPLGCYAVQLLRHGCPRWWIALLRPHSMPSTIEVKTAHRFCKIAKHLGLRIHEFLILGRSTYWQLPLVRPQMDEDEPQK